MSELNRLSLPFVLASVALLLGVTGCAEYAMNVQPNRPPWSVQRAQEEQEQVAREAGKQREAIGSWQSAHEDAPQVYRIGPRDELEVTVYGLETPGEPTGIVRTVSESGEVKLPWIGDISVAGLTPEELERQVQTAYAGDYLKDPRVTVRVTGYLSKQVIVTGAVGEPGIYPIQGTRASLLEVLFMAGGVGEGAGDEAVVLAPRVGMQVGDSEPQGNRALTVDLTRLLGEGDMSMNVEVRPGYVVTVPASRQGYYVLGYVRKPGNYDFKTAHRMTVLHAIARAGGPSGDGRTENGFLVREGADGKNEVIRVNLAKIVSGEMPAPHLKPGDGFILGTNFWAQAGHFVRGGANVTASATVSPQ